VSTKFREGKLGRACRAFKSEYTKHQTSTTVDNVDLSPSPDVTSTIPVTLPDSPSPDSNPLSRCSSAYHSYMALSGDEKRRGRISHARLWTEFHPEIGLRHDLDVASLAAIGEFTEQNIKRLEAMQEKEGYETVRPDDRQFR
jgi:hypothetical protein